MAWRPYENLIDGELDNRIPGKVTGWMRFYRRGKRPLKVTFDLAGDFHEDIRGMAIRFHNEEPSDRNGDRGGTYMDGFTSVQRGEVGDITAGISPGPWTEDLAQTLKAKLETNWDENGITGLAREARRRETADKMRRHIKAGDIYYPYVDYPYIEWYSDNGRVVLELDPSQIDVIEEAPQRREKTPAELAADDRKRARALGAFLTDAAQSISSESDHRDEQSSR